jgi:ABC-type glycerol-3-phosphate transport system substrate-binding protein
MKKILVILLGLCAFTLPLSAGGQSGGQAAAKPVELAFWFYRETDLIEDLMDELVAKVNKLYPNIKVNPELQSWDTGPERFTLALATGQTPDLIMDGYSRLAPAVNTGLTLDVTDVVQQISPYINPPARHMGMVNGRNMAIDLGISPAYGISVNRTLLKKLGVDNMLPTDKLHWSYDQFLNLCRAIRRADPNVAAIDLFAGSRSADAWYYSWVLATGSDILNPEHTAVVVDNDNALKAITLFKTLIDENLTSPGAATMVDTDTDPKFLMAQQTVMHYWSANSAVNSTVSMLRGEIDFFEWDFVAIPTPDGRADPRVATWGGSSFAGFKKDGNADRIDAIKKFLLTAYSSLEIFQQLSAATGTSYIIKGTETKMPTPEIDQLVAWSNDYTLKYSTSAFGILEPWWTEFREALYPQLQDLYVGRATPKQVLENWTKNGNTIITNALR